MISQVIIIPQLLSDFKGISQKTVHFPPRFSGRPPEKFFGKNGTNVCFLRKAVV